jgi:4-amino-4-deoxy-L-arabinose transferase-like glycosyltransferase
MNGGVIVAAIVALPIYFVRSRGWKRGALATVGAAVVLGITLLLGELGERLGHALR